MLTWLSNSDNLKAKESERKKIPGVAVSLIATAITNALHC